MRKSLPKIKAIEGYYTRTLSEAFILAIGSGRKSSEPPCSLPTMQSQKNDTRT